MTRPDEQDALAELIEDVGARWQIEPELAAVGIVLRAEARFTYRRARGTVLTDRTVAGLREKIKAVDAKHACDL